MSYETIIYETIEHIGIIRFDRPEVLNAINTRMMQELKDVLGRISEEESIRVLVLTGSGDKSFVAGADIAEMRNLDPIQGKLFSRQGLEIMSMLESLRIPVIACVNGYALGGGMEIAMASDFIYAADTAIFGQPEINLGIIPGFGGTQRLPRIVGKPRAKELCMTGSTFGADEALNMGLVNRVFPEGSLWEETFLTAKQLGTKGRMSLEAVKRTINDGFDVVLEEGCRLESEAFSECVASEDAQEGMGAFLEKREPDFKS